MGAMPMCLSHPPEIFTSGCYHCVFVFPWWNLRYHIQTLASIGCGWWSAMDWKSVSFSKQTMETGYLALDESIRVGSPGWDQHLQRKRKGWDRSVSSPSSPLSSCIPFPYPPLYSPSLPPLSLSPPPPSPLPSPPPPPSPYSFASMRKSSCVDIPKKALPTSLLT